MSEVYWIRTETRPGWKQSSLVDFTNVVNSGPLTFGIYRWPGSSKPKETQYPYAAFYWATSPVVLPGGDMYSLDLWPPEVIAVFAVREK
jgi:hypothetical protein